MSARAHERMRIEWERQNAEQVAELQELTKRVEQADQVAFEAGPPGGCHECFSWASSILQLGHSWGHKAMCLCPSCDLQPANILTATPVLKAQCSVCKGPAPLLNWCSHECHEEPYNCTLVVYG